MKKVFLRIVACVLMVAILCGCDAITPLPDQSGTTNGGGTTNDTTQNGGSTTTPPDNSGSSSGGGGSSTGGGTYVDAQGFAYKLNAKGDGYLVTYTNAVTNKAKDITIPATYKGKPVVGIEEGAFAGHTALETVDIPASVVAIGATAFLTCLNLT